MQDEENTARGLQKRDPEAWAGIYEEYFPRVYRYIALRVGDKTEAEDLAEQVFLKLRRDENAGQFIARLLAQPGDLDRIGAFARLFLRVQVCL